MNERLTNQLINYIVDLVNKTVDKRLANVARIRPATVTGISGDGLRVSVKILGTDDVLENIENYDTRTVTVGMPCHLISWGPVNRMNNVALLFGGTAFRENET